MPAPIFCRVSPVPSTIAATARPDPVRRSRSRNFFLLPLGVAAQNSHKSLQGEESIMRAAVLVSLLLALAGAAVAQEPPRQITVQGAAEADAVPDLATVTAGVDTRAETAAAALAANSETMTAILAAIDAAGIERRDVQTSQLCLKPGLRALPRGRRGAARRRRLRGEQPRHGAGARHRRRSARVIDALAKAGANRLKGVELRGRRPQAAPRHGPRAGGRRRPRPRRALRPRRRRHARPGGLDPRDRRGAGPDHDARRGRRRGGRRSPPAP